MVFDRAGVVTTALMQIISKSSTPQSLQHHIEDLLRDEFADIQRQAATDLNRDA